MRRSRKKYEKPTHPFQAERIRYEHKLVSKYGLKNKREIWKAESVARRFRRMARQIISQEAAGKDIKIQKEQLFNRVKRLGLIKGKVKLDDILGLTVEDILDRRLQTIVYHKLANTPKQARQLIVHKHIQIDGKRISAPGYLVKKEEEAKIGFWPNSPFKGRFKVKKSLEFICPECGKDFGSEEGLAIHLGRVHG